MHQNLDTFAAAASTLLSAVAGSKFGQMIANMAPMPEWMSWLLGPFGALVGVLLALVWMSKRLAAADVREETRRREREEDRKTTQETLIALVRDTNSVVVAATEIMRSVQKTIEGCPGKMDNSNHR